MQIPELSKTHKIALFCLILTLLIVLVLLSTPTTDNVNSKKIDEIMEPQPDKPVKEDKKVEVTEIKSSPEAKKSIDPTVEKNKIAVMNDPEMVSLVELFAAYRKSGKNNIPEKILFPRKILKSLKKHC